MTCAGIVGGTASAATSQYAINTCKVDSVRFNVVFQAYGLGSSSGSVTSKDYGWKEWTTSWKEWYGRKHINYHTVCLRPFCLMELNICSIAAGTATPADGVPNDSGTADYCRTVDASKVYTYPSDKSATYQDLGESDAWDPFDAGWWESGASDIDGFWIRYIKYDGQSKGKFKRPVSSNVTSDMSQGMLGDGVGIRASGYSYGFYNGNVIRTDPNTGCLLVAFNENNYGYYDNGNWIVDSTRPSLSVPTVG